MALLDATSASSRGDVTPACPICGNTNANKTLQFEEKMFGMGDRFEYTDCGSCSAISIAREPSDLSKYYPPSSYYSVSEKTGLRKRLKHFRNLAYTVRYPGSALIRKYLPNTAIDTTLLASGGNRQCRILDVGCGDGELLCALAQLGMQNLTGVDPLIKSGAQTPGVHLIRGTLSEIVGEYDLITFHHSLEHVREPKSVLVNAGKLLAPDGQILIRIPTRDSLAYKMYGENWFQIDAPRHMCLHSRLSIGMVAAQAGLKIRSVECDSQPMQFWASEMYQDGLSLHAPAQKKYRRRRARFYRELADFANKNLLGDQLVISLVRS